MINANLDVWVDEKMVRVSSSEGEARIPNEIGRTLDRVGGTLQGLRQGQRTESEKPLRDLGTHLFRALFSGETLEMYRHTLVQGYKLREGVRIRLQFGVPALQELPWEFMYDPEEEGFLSISSWTPVVRYFSAARPASRPSEERPLRLLYVSAMPAGLAPFSEDADRRAIREGLQRLVDRNMLEIDWLTHASRESLQTRLREKCDIFHFFGYGGRDKDSGQAFVVLEDQAGQRQILGVDQLSVMLQDNDIQLAVLNTNDSVHSSAALAKAGVAGVVGWGSAVMDRDAAEFSRIFYSALADGFSVDQAVTEARKGLFLSSPALAWGFLHLSTRLPDAVLFDQSLVKSSTNVRGEVIYSGGGMVTQKYNPVSGKQIGKGGDFLGRDKVISGDYARPVQQNAIEGQIRGGGVAIGAAEEPLRFDPQRVQTHLEQLEKSIATDPDLSPAQRIQGMTYVEDWRDALTTHPPNAKEIDDLRIQIAQLGAGPARAVESVWQELKGG
jgi:hypothetical protein